MTEEENAFRRHLISPLLAQRANGLKYYSTHSTVRVRGLIHRDFNENVSFENELSKIGVKKRKHRNEPKDYLIIQIYIFFQIDTNQKRYNYAYKQTKKKTDSSGRYGLQIYNIYYIIHYIQCHNYIQEHSKQQQQEQQLQKLK